jgi:hypothetical protein
MRIFVHLAMFSSNHPFQEYRYGVSLRVWPNESRYFLLGGTFTDVGDASPLIITDPNDERRGKTLANADFQLAWVLDLGPADVEREDRYLLTLRGGVIDSLTGGGFDIDFLRYLRISFDARDRHRDERRFYEDISPLYARAYLSVRLLKYFRVYAGADNLAHKAVMSFGVSIEWEDKDIRNIVGIAGSAY